MFYHLFQLKDFGTNNSENKGEDKPSLFNYLIRKRLKKSNQKSLKGKIIMGRD